MKFSEIKKRAEDEWNQLQQSKEPTLFIGAATCGRSAGALAVKKTFQDELFNIQSFFKILSRQKTGLFSISPVFLFLTYLIIESSG